MTLMDAPKYNASRENRNRNLGIAAVVILIVAFAAGISFYLDMPWQLWHLPSDHRVNQFFSAIEGGNLQKAYALWNNDPNWQQHPTQYSVYNFDQFQKDWGPASDYGVIKSHKIIVAKTVGNGVVMGVDINGGKTPIFLRVDHTKTIGFSPVELYTGP
ncbi:MAG TPA: hypothetical protein VFW25_12835 [Silvibacterium sp.]|nr:hypothetical protein [Silvibacterium sp.]